MDKVVTEEIDELLRQLWDQFIDMHNELRDLTGEVRALQRSMDGQLGMIRQQMGSFLGFQRLQDESIQLLRERVERIERRLDLASGD